LSVLHASVRHRLFIALWPTAAVAQHLARLTSALQAEYGGRKIIQKNQHITVVFLGGITIDRIADVQGAMRAAAGQAFELQLDAVEYRRRGGMLWARATQVPDALDTLVRRLRASLRDLGFAIEVRAFVPHVTLLRDARKPAQLGTLQARWRVNELTLVRSHLDNSGTRYEVVFRVPLPG
jgi:RNA 2',3'-cyclic 3'-phosphodiesterase